MEEGWGIELCDALLLCVGISGKHVAVYSDLSLRYKCILGRRLGQRPNLRIRHLSFVICGCN